MVKSAATPQDRSGKTGLPNVTLDEFSVPQIGSGKIASTQRHSHKTGVTKVGTGEINRVQIKILEDTAPQATFLAVGEDSAQRTAAVGREALSLRFKVVGFS